MRPNECKGAQCEYLARMVMDREEYYCTDTNMNITNVWNCGIVDEWWLSCDKEVTPKKEELGPLGLRQDEMG